MPRLKIVPQDVVKSAPGQPGFSRHYAKLPLSVIEFNQNIFVFVHVKKYKHERYNMQPLCGNLFRTDGK